MDRRAMLRGGLVVGGIAGLGLVAKAGFEGTLFAHEAHEDLRSLAVGFSAAPDALAETIAEDGAAALLRGAEIAGVERSFVQAHSAPLIEGTRVFENAVNAETLSQVSTQFLEQARLSTTPADFEDLEASALLDVFSLTWALPSPVAALTTNWRYTWPRDTTHTIVALGERGCGQWALDLLVILALMQRPDGTFEARYQPGTSTPPDDRLPQFDGVGWFLWAAGTLARLGVLTPTALDDGAAASLADIFTATTMLPTSSLAAPGARFELNAQRRLSTSLARAAKAAYDATSNQTRLPAASPDYWEVPEKRLTLATAAMTLSALQNAAALSNYGLLDEETVGANTKDLATRAAETQEALVRTFNVSDFQRYPRGGGLDAGLLMLMPPYLDRSFAHDYPGIVARIDDAWQEMQRPAGGVAPGAGWKKDGMSWTPQTAMFAQAYARLGAAEQASQILRWLRDHRTSVGAISEKVLANGSPAAVAPLSWSASLVLSALHTLAP